LKKQGISDGKIARNYHRSKKEGKKDEKNNRTVIQFGKEAE